MNLCFRRRVQRIREASSRPVPGLDQLCLEKPQDHPAANEKTATRPSVSPTTRRTARPVSLATAD